MNKLSWLIYFGELSHNVSGLIVVLTIVTFSYSCALAIKENTVVVHRSFLACMALWVVMAILPSKDTVYAIAASEVGEQFLVSKTADKATKALDAWLDRQIAGEQPAK